MNQLGRHGSIGYEDLMQELEAIEHNLLQEGSPQAMELMALDSKIRSRFQNLENRVWERLQFLSEEDAFDDDLSVDEIRSLIPQDLDSFPSLEEIEKTRKKKKSYETIGMAALLALITALGVFGLASVLQLTLTWLV